MSFLTNEIWIDPSFTGTGVLIVKEKEEAGAKESHVYFELISEPKTKRSFQRYSDALLKMKDKFTALLEKYFSDGEPFYAYQEIPVVASFSSAGLYALGTRFSEVLLSFDNLEDILLIPPSWIKRAFKRNDGVVSTREKKELSYKALLKLKNQGVHFHNEQLLKAAGCDVATAFFFKLYTEKENRVWYSYRLADQT